jgi:hypothetical protein
MMTPVYEVTVRRIGGRDTSERGLPRSWSWITPINTNAGTTEMIELRPQDGYGYEALRIEFTNWEPGPASGWLAATLLLEYAANGQPIGRRPAIVYTEPCDVASYVGFIDTVYGEVYSVGIRRFNGGQS